jgi:hypothetical protein
MDRIIQPTPRGADLYKWAEEVQSKGLQERYK